MSFTLSWINTYSTNTNVTGQRVSKRLKTVGGTWLTTGFTPANDLPKTATNATSDIISENKVHEFKVEALCTVGGPSPNNNGIQEQIFWSCLIPIVTSTANNTTFTLNTSATDITQIHVKLIKDSDNSIVYDQVLNVVSGQVTNTQTGLDYSTGYHWEYSMIAPVGAANQDSQTYLGFCGPFNITTGTAPSCPLPSSLSVLANY